MSACPTMQKDQCRVMPTCSLRRARRARRTNTRPTSLSLSHSVRGPCLYRLHRQHVVFAPYRRQETTQCSECVSTLEQEPSRMSRDRYCTSKRHLQGIVRTTFVMRRPRVTVHLSFNRTSVSERLRLGVLDQFLLRLCTSVRKRLYITLRE